MLLVIDTATAACSVALFDQDRLVGERHVLVGRGHAERLIPMIADLVAGGERVTGIRVDCGPGSFTGVRVGVAAARALALGWGVTAAGYSSMALIAAAALANGGEALVAITGGHGEIFVQPFSGHPLRETGPLRNLTPPDAGAMFATALVLGSGAAALVAARGHGEAIDRLPRAADFALLPPALAQLAPTPLYGRAPDAKPAG